jgi:ubiquinone/menaquinone biosynthesis C-methylase UbiE
VIAEKSNQPASRVRDIYQELSRETSLEGLLSAARISYRAPQDAASLKDIPDESLDMVFSNSVLEHIPGQVIGQIVRESWRVLKRDGLTVHAVACNDHYAHFDRSISFINFLKYPAGRWQFWNNPLNYQNRLRAPDFIRLVDSNGFEILHEARVVRPGTREALSKMVVAPEFRSYRAEDLIATTVGFVARKQDLRRAREFDGGTAPTRDAIEADNG